MPTGVLSRRAGRETTWKQTWRGCFFSNYLYDVGEAGEVDDPWDVIGQPDLSEGCSVVELTADVSTVTLYAANQERSRDNDGGDVVVVWWVVDGPTCVGTVSCAGLETFVSDVVDDVDKVGNRRQLVVCHKVDPAVAEPPYDVFDDGEACRVDPEFVIVAQALAQGFWTTFRRHKVDAKYPCKSPRRVASAGVLGRKC